MTEWNFYQTPHTGVEESDLATLTRTNVFNTIRYPINMKISNFGAYSVGLRSSSDYTKTQLIFSSKDNSANWEVITPDWQYAERDENPYVVGSTVKKTRDDQFFRMTMAKDNGASIDEPNTDVSDTNEASAAGMVSGKNYPSEGWRSFGGKYDFLPYTGVLR